MQEQESQILITLVAGTVLLLLFAIALIAFLLLYQRKKIVHALEKQRLQDEFEQELLKSRLEIQEETLTVIGRDLHDNVGQILSVVKLYLASLGQDTQGDIQSRISKAETLLGESIHDLRDLAHLLSPEDLRTFSLTKSLEKLAKQISQSGGIRCVFSIDDFPLFPDLQKEIILFRMAQELVNNAIRHGKAEVISIVMTQTDYGFCIQVTDNGVGFDPDQTEEHGQGIKNLRRRAEILPAKLIFDSANGSGTIATICIEQNIDANEV